MTAQRNSKPLGTIPPTLTQEEISLGNNDRARELLARLEFRYRRRLDRSAMPIGGREGLFVSCGYVVTAKEDIIAQLDKDVKALKSRMK